MYNLIETEDNRFWQGNTKSLSHSFVSMEHSPPWTAEFEKKDPFKRKEYTSYDGEKFEDETN